MLTCQQLTEVITEYAEGRMPFGRRFLVWMHLMMCRDCRVYMRQMKQTAHMLGHLPAATAQEALSDTTREALMRRFSALHQPPASDAADAPRRAAPK